MSTPKGWASSDKEQREGAQFATLEPTGEKTHGLTVLTRGSNFLVASDAIDTVITTPTEIKDVGQKRLGINVHGARKGDSYLFTSGLHVGREVKVLSIIDVNTVEIVPELPSDPSVADTLDHLRPVSPRLSSAGESSVSSGPIQFVLDAANVTVSEDTVTPANNRPLPVKLVGVTGDVTITADNLNVQLSHTGATPDSTQIGDGTNLLAISGTGSAAVEDTVAQGSLASINTKTPALGAALIAASTPVNIASDQTVSVSAASLPLPALASTSALQTTGNVSLATIAGAVLGSEMQIDIVGAGTLMLDATGSSIGSDTSSIDGKTPALGAAVIASSVPVNIASDQVVPISSPVLTDIETNTNPLDVDTAIYTDFSSSNLPGNATNPLELVASLGTNIKKIQVADTGGVPMELMTGAAASEVRKLLIGPGSDQAVEVDLPSTTRISIRRVDDAAALALGDFSINFLGDA